MRVPLRTSLPTVLAFGVVATLLVARASADSAHRSPTATGSSSGWVSSALPGTPMPGSTAATPAWWSPGGSVLGLTVTGEAATRGTGVGARDAAISRAIAGAKNEASTAAAAAGIALGRILNMQ